jgi:hypothetical protein
VNAAVARQGFSRPRPPPASSQRPYFASWRRWNEHVPELSPSWAAACVAVSGPWVRSSPMSARSASRNGVHVASWKMIPSVIRSPEWTVATPWRIVVR